MDKGFCWLFLLSGSHSSIITNSVTVHNVSSEQVVYGQKFLEAYKISFGCIDKCLVNDRRRLGNREKKNKQTKTEKRESKTLMGFI